MYVCVGVQKISFEYRSLQGRGLHSRNTIWLFRVVCCLDHCRVMFRCCIYYICICVCVCVWVKGVVSKYLERVFCLDFVVHHLWILFIFVYRFVVCWFFVQIGVCRFVCLCGRCLCRALVSLVNRGWPGGQYTYIDRIGEAISSGHSV